MWSRNSFIFEGGRRWEYRGRGRRCRAGDRGKEVGVGVSTWDWNDSITDNSIEKPVHIDALVSVISCDKITVWYSVEWCRI